MLNELIGSVVQVLLFAAVPFVVWFLTARKTGSKGSEGSKDTFFSWIGLKRPVCENVGKTILLTAAATLIYIGATIFSIKILPEGVTTAGAQFAGQGLVAIPSVIFYAFLRTALSEEILFRGFILKRVQEKLGFAVGNTVQAVLFGLMHGIPFGIATKSVPAFLLLTLMPGLFGWYQGWLNEKQCGGSIVPSWVLHGCVNFVTAIMSL